MRVIVTEHHGLEGLPLPTEAVVLPWTSVIRIARAGECYVGHDPYSESRKHRKRPWAVFCRRPKNMTDGLMSHHHTPEAAVKAALKLMGRA